MKTQTCVNCAMDYKNLDLYGYCPDCASIRGPIKPLDQWTPDEIMADPSASDWLKGALRSALLRDPVDAANDADALAIVIRSNLKRALGRGA